MTERIIQNQCCPPLWVHALVQRSVLPAARHRQSSGRHMRAHAAFRAFGCGAIGDPAESGFRAPIPCWADSRTLRRAPPQWQGSWPSATCTSRHNVVLSPPSHICAYMGWGYGQCEGGGEREKEGRYIYNYPLFYVLFCSIFFHSHSSSFTPQVGGVAGSSFTLDPSFSRQFHCGVRQRLTGRSAGGGRLSRGCE